MIKPHDLSCKVYQTLKTSGLKAQGFDAAGISAIDEIKVTCHSSL